MQMKNMAYEMFSIYKDKAPAIGTVQKAAGYEACKRWIDVSVALCALFLLSPFSPSSPSALSWKTRQERFSMYITELVIEEKSWGCISFGAWCIMPRT